LNHKYKVESDKDREEIMNIFDIDTIRFTNEEINLELEKVLSKIKQYISKKIEV